MSRRETFLESARAENERLLAATVAEEETRSATSRALETDLREIRDGLRRLEERLSGGRQPGQPLGTQVAEPPVREVLNWILVGALLALLAMSVLKPDWSLRSDQKAALLLGEGLHRILSTMGEEERAEVLNALWESSAPSTAASD